MRVDSVNTLPVMGHAYWPSVFLWNVSFTRSLPLSGAPVTGCVWCLRKYGTMCCRSKMNPSGVIIGRSNGASDSAQQSKGSRRYLATVFCLCPPKCSAHSLLVMKSLSLLCWFFPIATVCQHQVYQPLQLACAAFCRARREYFGRELPRANEFSSGGLGVKCERSH